VGTSQRAALFTRTKPNFRGCRCDAKTSNDGNRKRCGRRHCDGSYHFAIAVWRAKAAESQCVKYWEIIADNLKTAGWSLGCIAAIDSNGRTIWIADAHRGDGMQTGKKFRVTLVKPDSPLFEITPVLVCFDDVTNHIVNTNHGIV
jgi:hypothetical protein